MEIVLEGERSEKYEVGQVVAGVFKVPDTVQLKAADVTIALIGVAEVKWCPQESLYGMYQIIPPVVLHETKRYLELFKDISDQDIVKVNGGQQISFQFPLPTTGGIPSSFKSPDGAIVYHIVAQINNSDNKEERIDREIEVLSPITQCLKVPVHNMVEKDFGVLSLASGRIILNASLVRKGWFPGETVVLHIDVNNESSVEATPRATLYKTVVYLFGERHKASQFALTDAVVGQKVDKHSNGKEVLAIPIPQDIPLTIKTELIAVKYFIHVTLDIPHAFDLHVNLPILVATQSALNN